MCSLLKFDDFIVLVFIGSKISIGDVRSESLSIRNVTTLIENDT